MNSGALARSVVRTARDAADLLSPYFQDCTDEKLIVAHLGAGGAMLRLVEEEGGVGAVGLPVRVILAEALRLGSEALIVAHNHPSGDAMPSAADLAASGRLAETAGELGIIIRDHLIFARGASVSLRALGLL